MTGFVRRGALLDHTAQLAGAELAFANQMRSMDSGRWRWLAFLGESGPLVNRLRMESVDVRVRPLPSSLRRIKQNEIRAVSFTHPVRGAGVALYVMQLARDLSRARVDLIHINSMRMGPLGLGAAKVLGLPVVWQMHSVAAPPAMSRAAVRLARFVASHVDHVICPSEAIAKTLGNIGSDRLSVIPNGIDTRRFQTDGADRGSRVGMIARLAPIKGQDVFVDAAAILAPKHPEADFVVAGAPLFGEERYEAELLQRRARRNSPVRFLGHVEEVPTLLNDIDVYVHASVTAEGLPLSLIEAMMAGKAIVATAPGGPSEMIQDGVTGRLIPPADARALADAIAELLSDPGAARAMGHRAREVALERYDIRKTAPMIENIYESVLARRKERTFAPA